MLTASKVVGSGPAISPLKTLPLAEVTNQVSSDDTLLAFNKNITSDGPGAQGPITAPKAALQELIAEQHEQHEEVEHSPAQADVVAADFHIRHDRVVNKSRKGSKSSEKKNKKKKNEPRHKRKQREAFASEAQREGTNKKLKQKRAAKARQAARGAKVEMTEGFLRPDSAAPSSPTSTGGSPTSSISVAHVPTSKAEMKKNKKNPEACIDDFIGCSEGKPAEPAFPSIPVHSNPFSVLLEECGAADEEAVPATKKPREGLFWRGVRFVGGLVASAAALVKTACTVVTETAAAVVNCLLSKRS